MHNIKININGLINFDQKFEKMLLTLIHHSPLLLPTELWGNMLGELFFGHHYHRSDELATRVV